MALSNRDRIGRTFELFGTALDEFHTYVLAKEIPAIQDRSPGDRRVAR